MEDIIKCQFIPKMKILRLRAMVQHCFIVYKVLIIFEMKIYHGLKLKHNDYITFQNFYAA